MNSFDNISKVCQRVDCTNESYYIPQLHFFAKGILNRNKPPMEMNMSVAICKECSKKITVSEFLNDNMKELVNTICKGSGVAKPNYKKTKLEFMRILSIPYKMPKKLIRGDNEKT